MRRCCLGRGEWHSGCVDEGGCTYGLGQSIADHVRRKLKVHKLRSLEHVDDLSSPFKSASPTYAAVQVGALAGGFGSMVGVGGGVLISPIIANACK